MEVAARPAATLSFEVGGLADSSFPGGRSDLETMIRDEILGMIEERCPCLEVEMAESQFVGTLHRNDAGKWVSF